MLLLAQIFDEYVIVIWTNEKVGECVYDRKQQPQPVLQENQGFTFPSEMTKVEETVGSPAFNQISCLGWKCLVGPRQVENKTVEGRFIYYKINRKRGHEKRSAKKA